MVGERGPELVRLASLAERLPQRRPGVRTPGVLVLTDPNRTPDVLALAAQLPAGVGLVYRHFGCESRWAVAGALAARAAGQGFTLLVAADPALALSVGAHGVHWPERMSGRAAALRWRRARPGWLVTAAAHGARGLAQAAALGADAALLSPVFTSRSASAGRPMGPFRFGRLVGAAGVPVYALGGVRSHNAWRVADWAAGFGVVDAARLEAEG